jgi:hypothetical protein
METLGRYEIHEVLDHIKGGHDREYDGWVVNMGSLRYQTFARSTTCVRCGLEGTHFLLQRWRKQETTPPNRAHFNLYGERDGKLVLFTKDHIVPRSKKGSNHPDNLVTMCAPCNGAKADGV